MTAAVSFWLYGNPPGALGFFDAGGAPSDITPVPAKPAAAPLAYMNKGAEPAAAPPPLAPPAPVPAPPGSPRPRNTRGPGAPGVRGDRRAFRAGREPYTGLRRAPVIVWLAGARDRADPCEILARDGWRCQWRAVTGNACSGSAGP